MLIRLFCILVVIAFSYNAFAAGSCSEPAEPGCASSEDTYKNKETYASCAAAFEAVSKKTAEYIDCMKSELKETADKVQKKADDITDKMNSSMQKFNCKADPKAVC